MGGGGFRCLPELMGNKLPFHCQCGQHLWLQDLLPTVGALLDPSERPLWTEERNRGGKTHFSQAKREVGKSGTCPISLPRDPHACGKSLHVACGQPHGGVTIPLPTDITAEGPKNAPSAPPPKLVSHVTLDSCQLIHTSVLLHGQKRDLRQFIGLFKPETHSCFG